MSRSVANQVVITADAHVGETDALVERLPAQFRRQFPRLVVDSDGNFDVEVNGKSVQGVPQRKPTEEDLRREFRSDPSQGTDLARRYADMKTETVDAQVIFPNIGLGCSMGTGSSDFYHAWARAHNDFVWEAFADDRHRFKPAAMLAVDDFEQTLAEAKRCIELGLCTLFLPATVPWQPYRLPIYEPLWSLAEEAAVPVNFHIFSGNLALGGGFADVANLNQSRYDLIKAVKNGRQPEEEELNTVLGMAAGMSPIVELIGAGVLERHPKLRMVVTESECGWLAWVLQAMDQMQQRRYLDMRQLPLKASEYFLRQGAITLSDDPVALNNVCFTGTDCLLWGNDYPHDEGTFPNSLSAIERIRSSLPPEQAAHVLSGHAASLYGFDLDYLASHHL